MLSGVKGTKVAEREEKAIQQMQKEYHETEDLMKVYKSLAMEQRREIEMLRKQEQIRNQFMRDGDQPRSRRQA
jgi:hypothetical protein